MNQSVFLYLIAGATSFVLSLHSAITSDGGIPSAIVGVACMLAASFRWRAKE